MSKLGPSASGNVLVAFHHPLRILIWIWHCAGCHWDLYPPAMEGLPLQALPYGCVLMRGPQQLPSYLSFAFLKEAATFVEAFPAAER